MTNVTLGNVSHHPHRGGWKAALATGVVTSVLASTAPAAAWTPQAQAGSEHHAVRRHAAAPVYRSGPYASARRSEPYARARGADRDDNMNNNYNTTNTPPKPHKDFQDYH